MPVPSVRPLAVQLGTAELDAGAEPERLAKVERLRPRPSTPEPPADDSGA